MEHMADNKCQNNSENKSGSLPQYGKKGHKPRRPYAVKEVSLDSIHSNAIEYWNKTSGFKDVTKFAWNNIIGYPMDSSNIYPGATGEVNPSAIMKIEFVPGPGWAKSVDDGVNRSLAKTMARIRANLSTSNIGFETADLGIMLASTSSIATNIALAKRVLESTTVWRDRNYAYPRGLVKAQGFNWEDVAFNVNTYIPKLNSLIDMYNGMSLLDIFDVYDRQYSLTHNIFADEDSQFGQLYIFVPTGYYVYNDTATPSMADYKKFPEFKTFDDLLNVINEQIQSWYTSSDLYLINGVLQRAFKDAPRQKIPHYEGETISPVVERTFLMQIMNMSIYPELKNLSITQDPTTQNYVIWTPVANCSGKKQDLLRADKQILRIFEEDVSADDNMEMTRLMGFLGGAAGMDKHYFCTNCGSELVVGMSIYEYIATTNEVIETKYNSNIITILDNAGNIYNSSMHHVLALMPFRYIPAMWINESTTIANTLISGCIGDMYNWMFYNRADWDKLQFQAYQSFWEPKNI